MSQVGWFDASRHHGGVVGDLGENVKAAVARLENSASGMPAPARGATDAWRATPFGASLRRPRDAARTFVPGGLVPGLDHCNVDCDRQTYLALPDVRTNDWYRSLFAFADFLPFADEAALCARRRGLSLGSTPRRARPAGRGRPRERGADAAFIRVAGAPWRVSWVASPHATPRRCRFARLPIRLGTNQLYRNSPAARLFIWDWIAMSMREAATFCSENPLGDQLTLTILAFNRSLPFVDTCVYARDHDFTAFVNRGGRTRACANMEKNVSHFLGALAAGAYEVIPLSNFSGIVDATAHADTCHAAWLAWPGKARRRRVRRRRF